MSSRKPRPSATASAAATSSPDHVAETLREGVRTGRYKPGQRLVEAELTQQLHLSRGPIREALKLLAAEGLVELHRHRGATLRQLSRREVHDLLVIQENLTALAARLAAEKMHDASCRARLRSVLSGVNAAYRSKALEGELLDARVRFYGELVAIGGNTELGRFVPIPQTNLLRAQFDRHLPPAERAQRRRDLNEVAGLILAGKAGPAATAMSRYIRRTRLAIEALPDAVFAASA